MPHDLPVGEALKRTIDAYLTGDVTSVPSGDLKSRKQHDGDLDAQENTDAEPPLELSDESVKAPTNTQL